jgi:hypothetical protein
MYSVLISDTFLSCLPFNTSIAWVPLWGPVLALLYLARSPTTSRKLGDRYLRNVNDVLPQSARIDEVNSRGNSISDSNEGDLYSDINQSHRLAGYSDSHYTSDSSIAYNFENGQSVAGTPGTVGLDSFAYRP